MMQGFAAGEAKQPQLTPEQQAQLMQMLQQQQAKAITVDEAFKGLPADLASYNGKVFTKKELLATISQQIPGGKMPPGFTAERAMQMAPDLVKSMISKDLLVAAAKKAGFIPSAEMAKKAIEDQIKNAPAEQKQMIAQMLAQQNTTIDQMVAKQSADPMIQESVAIEEFLKKVVFKGVKVTEVDALKYYNANPKDFIQPGDPADSLRASHILVMVKENATDKEKKDAENKIKAILAELKANPADFEKLAKTNSQCPSGAQGGSLGAFGKGQMVPEFEKAVLALKDGEISDIVKTQFGYHIIRRDAAMKEHKLPFGQVKDQLISTLKGMEEQKVFQQYIAEMLKKADFKLLFTAAAPAPKAPVAAPAAK
jgi:parvulin-like peptidyl-prolyl isomerase